MRTDDDRAQMMPKLHAYDVKVLREIEQAQVRHVTAEYQPGSPRLERLYRQLDDLARFEGASVGETI